MGRKFRIILSLAALLALGIFFKPVVPGGKGEAGISRVPGI